MNESIKSCIKSLPPLPESVAQIQRICAMPDASLADLSAVVEKDPMITANLLRAANSPFYGFSREIKNVQQAVSLFGMATVKGLALSGAIKNVLKIDLSPYDMTPSDFATISQVHFAFVNSWIKNVSRPALDVLAPSAFLHLTGAVVIAQDILNQRKTEDFKKLLAEGAVVCDAERAIVGVSTPHVTAEIFEHWRFDTSMIEAIRASEYPNEAPSELKFNASVLATARLAFPVGRKAGEETFAKASEFSASCNFDVKLLQAAAQDTLEKLNA
jgi:HD-like signal output (HDOD) protein